MPSTLITETEWETGGIVYTAHGTELRLLVTPKRKNRWQITIQRGETIVTMAVLDPADASQRDKCLRGLELSTDEMQVLQGVLLQVALHAAEDTERWIAWHAAEAERAAAERVTATAVVQEAERETHTAAAWSAARQVLCDPSLLYRAGSVLQALGLAGERVNSLLLYLALTSRIGERPINVAVKGASSAGKSHQVKTVVRLFPAQAVWELSGMSAKALVYTPEEFAHRYILIYEYVGSEDADYFVRTLQSEGRLRYLTVLSTPDGPQACFIDKPGPTGFITTTTNPTLHEENESRLWSLVVDESAEQTAAVLRAVAEQYAAGDGIPDLAPWLASQEWLGLAGATRATIRYAEWLADQMPRQPLRIRRDFGRLLTLVETSALLLQVQRDRDDAGRVIATVHDFANAHALAGGVFQDALLQVPKRTRELLTQIQTVYERKVQEDGDAAIVSYRELMAETHLDKAALSRRLKPALRAGLLENLEPRQGVEAKLRPHLELLGTVPGLPTPEQLAEAFPDLAQGEWLNPITGERKYFLSQVPATPTTVTTVAVDSHESRAGIGIAASATVAASLTTPDNGSLDQAIGPEILNGTVATVVEEHATVAASTNPDPVGDCDTPAGTVATVVGVAGEPAEKNSRAVMGVTQPETVIITEPEQLRDALPALLAAEAVGLDTETTGLDPLADRVRLVQLAVPGRTYIVDLNTIDAPALTPVLAQARRLVGHNLKFDLCFAVAAGLPVPDGARLFDTMLAAQLLGAGTPDGYLNRCGLAAVTERTLGVTLDKTQQVSDWSGPLSGDQIAYAARDACILLPLAERLESELLQAKLMRAAELEFGCLPALVWLEQSGVPFNSEAWADLSDAALAEQLRLEDALTQEVGALGLFGGKPINWRSPQQVVKVLQARGHAITRTDETVLQTLAAQDPLVRQLLEYREASKRASTYGIEWLKHVHGQTGRVHADFLQLGSASGRMSCTRPNLQNIPRDLAYRACFRPAAGRVLVKVDYSQIELRIAAQISGDAAMRAAYQQGADLHTRTAAAVLGLAPEAISKADRQLAKALNFGLVYGMGAKRLREHAASGYGVALAEMDAIRFRAKFFQSYPGLQRWHRSAPEQTITTRTLTGRRRLSVERYTEKLNTPVQGSGADLLKLALARLWQDRAAAPSAVPVLVVHDEIVVECDAATAGDTAAWLRQHMMAAGEALLPDVPVEVEVTIAADWSGRPVDLSTA
jgi:DNA polymerase I